MEFNISSFNECDNCNAVNNCILFPFLKNNNCSEISDKYCKRVQYKNKELIIKQNLPINKVIFIRSGLVKVYSSTKYSEHIIKIVNSNTFIGLNNLYTKHSVYSAMTLEPTIACVIDSAFIKKIMCKNEDFNNYIIFLMVENKIFLQQRLMDQFNKNTLGKVAELLLYFSESIFYNDEFELNLTRKELSQYAGITRENLTKVLTTYKNEGLISLEGRKIKIKNKKKLYNLYINC